MAARCVEREAFHRLADLFIARPGAILYLDGLFDRRLQPIKRLRHEISGIVGKRVELLLVALHVVPVRRVCLGIRMLEMIPAAGKGRALGKNTDLAHQAGRHHYKTLLKQAARLGLIDEAGQTGAPVDGVDYVRLESQEAGDLGGIFGCQKFRPQLADHLHVRLALENCALEDIPGIAPIGIIVVHPGNGLEIGLAGEDVERRGNILGCRMRGRAEHVFVHTFVD